MHINTGQTSVEHFIWSLVEENNTQRIFLFDDKNDCRKIAVITLKYGILKCYPVIDDEIIWGDNLCFECLDDCETKRFEDVSDDILDSMIEKSEAAIVKYYEDYANNLDDFDDCEENEYSLEDEYFNPDI